jgi:thymidylate synthase
LSAKDKEEFVMLAERNPQVKNAVVRLMELSADEQTRLLYDSRKKMEWDNWGREKAAKKEGAEEIVDKMRRGGMSEDEIKRIIEL